MAQELKISTEWSLEADGWTWLEGGYAIPARFTVRAEARSWTAEVDVEVPERTQRRARTQSLTVSTDAPRGVSAAVLRQVPIREIVARGALNLLRKARTEEDGTEEGTTKLWPFDLSETEEAYAILERVVGYVEVPR